MAHTSSVVVPSDYERRINRNFEGVPCPIGDNAKYSYGTAGFRSKAEELTFIAFRVGYVAGLRARQLNKCIGLMITASHNPACDNGIKVVDPMGEMLAPEWENHATELVNQTDEQFPTAVETLEKSIILAKDLSSACLVVAIDTRLSGPHLRQAIIAGASLVTEQKVPVVDHGLLTTPQLSFITRCVNDPNFGTPSEEGYYKKLGNAFHELLKMTPGNENPTLVLDCANGVGAKSMHKLLEHLPKDSLNVNFVNEDGELNHECGADFVKQSQRLPSSFQNVTIFTKCASLDGDADRLVYFRRAEDMTFDVVLLDGDRIAALFAKYIKEQLDGAGLADELTMGVVQTAYSNGASTRYFRDHLHIDPVFVPTGVKHLHHEACKFDIGVYFESNGHGTVTFSKKFKSLIRSDSSNEHIKRLYLISNVINEVVGDAIADLLAVELILRHYSWTPIDWEQKLYRAVPNVNVKVPVPDRSIFKTTWCETKILTPVDLQKQIEEIVKKADGIRSFVRPSGTENIVRVYAEAATPEATQTLGEEVAELVRKLAIV